MAAFNVAHQPSSSPPPPSRLFSLSDPLLDIDHIGDGSRAPPLVMMNPIPVVPQLHAVGVAAGGGGRPLAGRSDGMDAVPAADNAGGSGTTTARSTGAPFLSRAESGVRTTTTMNAANPTVGQDGSSTSAAVRAASSPPSVAAGTFVSPPAAAPRLSDAEQQAPPQRADSDGLAAANRARSLLSQVNSLIPRGAVADAVGAPPGLGGSSSGALQAVQAGVGSRPMAFQVEQRAAYPGGPPVTVKVESVVAAAPGHMRTPVPPPPPAVQQPGSAQRGSTTTKPLGESSPDDAAASAIAFAFGQAAAERGQGQLGGPAVDDDASAPHVPHHQNAAVPVEPAAADESSSAYGSTFQRMTKVERDAAVLSANPRATGTGRAAKRSRGNTTSGSGAVVALPEDDDAPFTAGNVTTTGTTMQRQRKGNAGLPLGPNGQLMEYHWFQEAGKARRGRKGGPARRVLVYGGTKYRGSKAHKLWELIKAHQVQLSSNAGGGGVGSSSSSSRGSLGAAPPPQQPAATASRVLSFGSTAAGTNVPSPNAAGGASHMSLGGRPSVITLSGQSSVGGVASPLQGRSSGGGDVLDDGARNNVHQPQLSWASSAGLITPAVPARDVPSRRASGAVAAAAPAASGGRMGVAAAAVVRQNTFTHEHLTSLTGSTGTRRSDETAGGGGTSDDASPVTRRLQAATRRDVAAATVAEFREIELGDDDSWSSSETTDDSEFDGFIVDEEDGELETHDGSSSSAPNSSDDDDDDDGATSISSSVETVELMRGQVPPPAAAGAGGGANVDHSVVDIVDSDDEDEVRVFAQPIHPESASGVIHHHSAQNSNAPAVSVAAGAARSEPTSALASLTMYGDEELEAPLMAPVPVAVVGEPMIAAPAGRRRANHFRGDADDDHGEVERAAPPGRSFPLSAKFPMTVVARSGGGMAAVLAAGAQHDEDDDDEGGAPQHPPQPPAGASLAPPIFAPRAAVAGSGHANPAAAGAGGGGGGSVVGGSVSNHRAMPPRPQVWQPPQRNDHPPLPSGDTTAGGRFAAHHQDANDIATEFVEMPQDEFVGGIGLAP